jgi:hypothetical protein
MACSLVFAGDNSKSAPKPDAIVLARLVEIPGKLPGNDLYNYVYIFKYRVVKVELGKVPNRKSTWASTIRLWRVPRSRTAWIPW